MDMDGVEHITSDGIAREMQKNTFLLALLANLRRKSAWLKGAHKSVFGAKCVRDTMPASKNTEMSLKVNC